MKKILLFLVLVLGLNVATWGQAMLFDFDTTNPDLAFSGTWDENTPWPYTGFDKVTNPDATGINTSANVGKYTHKGSAISGLENALIGGTDPAFNEIDYNATPTISMKVWVGKPLNVKIKLFNNANYYTNWWPSNEITTRVTTTNKWVEVFFDISSMWAKDYDRINIFFDQDLADGSVDGDVYYFDDIKTLTSTPTGIEDATILETKFYPNPAQDEIYFNSSDTKEIKIYDLAAKLVYQTTLETNQLNISNLNPGVYFIKINEQISKLIKQ